MTRIRLRTAEGTPRNEEERAAEQEADDGRCKTFEKQL